MPIVIVDETTDDNDFAVIDTNVDSKIIIPTETEKASYTAPGSQKSMSLFEMDPSKFNAFYKKGSGSKKDFYDVFYKLFCKGCVQVNIINADRLSNEEDPDFEKIKASIRPKVWFK